jgi:hypothetical protein
MVVQLVQVIVQAVNMRILHPHAPFAIPIAQPVQLHLQTVYPVAFFLELKATFTVIKNAILTVLLHFSSQTLIIHVLDVIHPVMDALNHQPIVLHANLAFSELLVQLHALQIVEVDTMEILIL